MSPLVLGDPRFIYIPLWDTGEDDVYAYRCTPLWQAQGGRFAPIEALDAPFSDPVERLSVDLAVFDKAIEHVNRIVAQYGIVKMLIPVHMSTLLDGEARETYLSACSASVWSVFDNLCFEIIAVGADVTRERLAAAIEVIRPYGCQVFVCLDGNDLAPVPQGTEQPPVLVGRNVRRVQAAGGDVTSELVQFGERLAGSPFRSYVYGIETLEPTASAIAAGFTFIGSEALAPALEEPDQPVATDETARMLRALMTAKRRT